MIKIIAKDGVEIPQQGSEKAVGYDIVANNIITAYKGAQEVDKEKLERIRAGFERAGYIKLRPFERVLFGSGLILADMSDGLELQVRPRSGIALKRGLTVLNTPGTIDPDYRGEIGIIVCNVTPFLSHIDKNERIAQLVPKTTIVVPITETTESSSTTRGAGGFGSTGV